MKTNRLTQFIMATLALALLIPALAFADVVVVVSAESEATKLSRREVINIFMGRYRFLPSGRAIKPYDLPAEDSRKSRFYFALTGKDISDIDAYWSRLVLTGNSSPPDETNSQEQMLERIARNAGSIGYVDRSMINSRVRIIFEPER